MKAFAPAGVAGNRQHPLRIAGSCSPDYAAAHNNLGTALQQLHQTEAAGAEFQQAVKLAPDYWEARLNLGMNDMQAGRLDGARTEFEAVLRLKPDFAPAKSALAALAARRAGAKRD